MGNASGKESRSDHAHRSGSESYDGPINDQASSSRGDRSGRHDMSFLGLGGRSDNANDDPTNSARRETRQEREARKAEKERAARLKERERSMKEEGVDGGYLVTLGTYVGAEDFNKGIVRQLMIERRLAPFWRGLSDHSTSWTEHQLVAAARGRPIPAPDEIPEEEEEASGPSTPSNGLADKSIAIPGQRSEQQNQGMSGFSPLSASHPAFSSRQVESQSLPTASPLFRGRAKTLVSLTSKHSSQNEIVPQEITLPAEPRINGQPVEAYLYKDVNDCPICFLDYPPYLNKTRCCDQPICSECFVQVKRPDPHPPEHLDPDTPVPAPSEPRSLEDEINLVSEPSTCPFCKTMEFGVTYEPPPFRRGLAYASHGPSLARTGSAMSSSSSLTGNSGGRRRTTSLSANDSTVITTDRIRPEWATKLAHAKAQAARRAASATALHTAAYMMGPQGSGLLSRRRRGEARGEGPSQSNLEQLLAILETQEAARNARRESEGGNASSARGLFGARRASRTEEIEELMMMEAIRQSIAAEEDRKRKEEKDAAKQTKKDEKARAKEQKKAEKAAKKNGATVPSPAGSSFSLASASANTTTVEEDGKGKGKEINPVDSSASAYAFNPINEPTSTLYSETSRDEAQKHLQQSRANLDQSARAPSGAALPSNSLQTRSTDSSPSTSFVDSTLPSSRNDSTSEATGSKLAGGSLGSFAEENDSGSAPSLDPALSFSSLAAMIDSAGTNTEKDGSHGIGSSDSPVRQATDMQMPHSADERKLEQQAPVSPPTYRSSIDQKYRDDVALVEHHGEHETA